ncbi:MAG: hypothetical protein OEM27_02560 [Nitrospinota bacterium]|nr:hypothetical protein [Nitrospinota bacterium]
MDEQQLLKESSRKHGYWLMLLLFLFCFRVGAQLLQHFFPVSFLPAFEDWQSGALPYWVLVIFQIIIIVICFRITYQFVTGTVQSNHRTGKLCLLFGIIYFSIMLFRMVAGLTLAPDHAWLGARIPTLFHLVLATFLLILGHYHFKFGKGSARP